MHRQGINHGLRWGIAVCLVSALGTIFVQSRLILQLRRQNADAQQQNAATAHVSHAPVAAPAEPDLRDNSELLRLRNEVHQLREQVAQLRARPASIPPARTAETSPVAALDEITQLANAASQGDFTALDRLAELSAAAASGRTNVNQDTHRELRLAFSLLGAEAGKGNNNAFQALWRATRMKHLQGMATAGLGEAAGMGNEKALEPLLDPERFLLLQSSCTSALKPAADSGNVKAIDALAAVANDQNKRALWYMAADGLQKAAASGNATAIDALGVLARSENKGIRQTALRALENAAFNQHSRASDALRTLGYQ